MADLQHMVPEAGDATCILKMGAKRNKLLAVLLNCRLRCKREKAGIQLNDLGYHLYLKESR